MAANHEDCLHDAALYASCCDDFVKTVIGRHCPVFQFHKKEPYFPSSIPWFVEHSELILLLKSRKELDQREVLKKQDETTTIEDIREFQRQHPADKLMLVPDKACYGGCKDSMDDVPVYAHWKVVEGPDKSVEALEINYMLLYPYNGPIPIMNRVGLNLLELGNHPGDWEHVTIRCEPRNGHLLGVWFNTHRNRDGQWIPAADVTKTPDNRILVFVALNSHGTWPTAGTQWRVMAVINDVTDANGLMWLPKKCVVVTKHAVQSKRGERELEESVTHSCCCSRGSCLGAEAAAEAKEPTTEVEVTEEGAEWIDFRGYYAGSRAPCEQKWFNEAEPPVSRTTSERIFQHSKPELQSLVTAPSDD